jgi:hypothetical protein
MGTAGECAISDDELSRIRAAVISLTAAAGAIDLGTVHSHLSVPLGGVSSLAIALVVSKLVRENVLRVDDRWYGVKDKAPCVGIVSLRDRLDQPLRGVV